MGIVSKKLFEVYRAHRDKRFLFIKQLGNFGDDLLILGAEKLAKQASCQFRSISFKEFDNTTTSNEDVIYIHGGGNYNNIWAGASISALKKAIELETATVILGPQTFMIGELFLKKYYLEVLEKRQCRDLFVFTRDMISYQTLKKITPKDVHLDIDHDTALNLTFSDIYCHESKNNYTLYAIREDKESFDLAPINPFALKVDPTTFCHSFVDWVELHAKAKHVITNRLHSAIVGHILGKKVLILPNSYHKNRAVWEFSLKGRKVEWQDNLKHNTLFNWLNKIWIPVHPPFSKR